VITAPSSAPPAGVTYTLFDTDGHELYSTTGVYQPGASSASYLQTSYELYKGNSVTLSGNTISCAATPPSESLPCAQIDADGVVTQMAYDAQGDTTSSSTPDGNSGGELATTTYNFNADGEQTSTVSPDGNLAGANAGNYTTVTAYTGDGQVQSVTEGGGAGATVTPRTTTYFYDADGNEVQSTDSRGYTTSAAYDADDEQTMSTDPDGNSSLTCYDSQGNVAQTVPPIGVAAGSLTPASCPTSYPAGYSTRLAADATSYTFNAVGQQTAETTPAPAGQSSPQTTTTTYNAAGLPATVTYPATGGSGSPDTVTSYTYNADGQTVSETDGTGTTAATTTYCYDPNGDQTAVVPPDGNVAGTATCETSSPWTVSSSSYPTQAEYQTTSSYDSAGEMVSTTSPATSAAPDGEVTTYTYDPAGDQLTSTDPNGVTATSTYNPDGDETGTSYSGGAAPSVTYKYDAQDQVVSMTDSTGTTSYTYDPFSEMTSTTNGAGKTIGYAYNADGDPTSVTYPLPSTATWATTDNVTYAYDKADMLTSVTDFKGTTSAVGSTADGLPDSVALGSSGDTISTAYDNTGTPASISVKNGTSTLLSYSYSDAPDGNTLTETDTPSTGESPASYAFNQQGRVASMTPGSQSELNYGYDASGNLTTLPTGASGLYNPGSELSSSTLGGVATNYTYDADGNELTAKAGTTTIASGSWNGSDQLSGYSDSASVMSNATYDGNGNRTSVSMGGTQENFTWSPTSSGLLMDETNAYVYGTSGTPFEQVNLSTGQVSYLATDTIGSVRSVLNSSGSVTASTSYDAWGNPVTSNGLQSYTPFGYAGGYTDPTGLIYMINRYYDPATGQFLSVDPDVSDSGEPYSYADGNPVDMVDPNGLLPLELKLWTGVPYASENAFEIWLNDTVLFGQRQYRIKWLPGTPSDITNYGNRIIDIYTNYDWINEVKTGYTRWGSFIGGEIKRDNYLVWGPGDAQAQHCYRPAGSRKSVCESFLTFGGTYWFSAKGESGCQTESTQWGNCPVDKVLANLDDAYLNIVLMLLAPNDDQDKVKTWFEGKEVEKLVRQAAQTNGCPRSQVADLNDQYKIPHFVYQTATLNCSQ
jgi:RHS repeat-associated protein